jgi:DNA-binding NarL/FixJ family response regulator
MRTQESRHQATQSSILGKKALVAARRGDIDGARDCAWEALISAGGADFDPTEPGRAIARGGEAALWALGFVELLVGNVGEADRYLGAMTRTLLEAGIREPGEIRCLPDEIEALSALGRRDEAEALLEELESWADRLERPSVQCIASRCRGVLLAARDDAEAALAAFEEAAAIQPDLPLPFERGRTLLALGTQQRRMRQRRAARTTLESALAIFEELGAMLMAEKTRAELARIGGRAPSTHDLTPTERRIASLVAEGKKNKEVAAALVVSVHTVEAALTQIYRKLEIRSRTELAHQFPRQH